jgi:hypothetical protein
LFIKRKSIPEVEYLKEEETFKTTFRDVFNRNLKKAIVDSTGIQNTIAETNQLEAKLHYESNQMNRTVYKVKFNLDNTLRKNNVDVNKAILLLNDRISNSQMQCDKKESKEEVVNNAMKTIERIITKKNMKGVQENKPKRDVELRFSKSISLQVYNELATVTMSDSAGLDGSTSNNLHRYKKHQ